MAFAKLIDRHTIELAPLNLVTNDKTILNFKYNEDLMREYGYKPLEAGDEPDYSKPFHAEYEEQEDNIKEVIVYDPFPDDDPAADVGGDTLDNSGIFEQGGDVNG